MKQNDMIRLDGIKKYYYIGNNTIKAVDGIDIHIAEGEFAAVTGASGSGKSTLMHIIGCLDVATEGEYVLNGIPVSDYDENQLADIRNRQIGFVFQQFNLLPHLTAEENVEVPMAYAGLSRKSRREKSAELLASVGLSDRLGHRPSELSGGQQQRVSIARALANDPAIILGDEITGALDSKTGEEMLEILSGLNSEGKTIVMITHDSKVASHAGRIITLRDGIVESDTRNGGI